MLTSHITANACAQTNDLFSLCLFLQYRAKAQSKSVASNAGIRFSISHSGSAPATGSNVGSASATPKAAVAQMEAEAAVDAHSSAAKVPAQHQRPAVKSSSVLA